MDWHLSTGARTAWCEARNQPELGQKGVAHAIVNRVKSGRWGKTLYEVCTSEYQGVFQFSCWARNDPNRAKVCQVADSDTLLTKFAEIVCDALNGAPDPTGGATHYYNPKIAAEPPWVKGKPAEGVPPATFCCQLGDHLFYKDVR